MLMVVVGIKYNFIWSMSLASAWYIINVQGLFLGAVWK